MLFVLKEKDEFKVGVVASRKIGKAVLRNRAKRRLREIVRLSQHEIPKNTWIVLVARQKVLSGEFESMRRLFVRILNSHVKDN